MGRLVHRAVREHGRPACFCADASADAARRYTRDLLRCFGNATLVVAVSGRAYIFGGGGPSRPQTATTTTTTPIAARQGGRRGAGGAMAGDEIIDVARGGDVAEDVGPGARGQGSSGSTAPQGLGRPSARAPRGRRGRRRRVEVMPSSTRRARRAAALATIGTSKPVRATTPFGSRSRRRYRRAASATSACLRSRVAAAAPSPLRSRASRLRHAVLQSCRSSSRPAMRRHALTSSRLPPRAMRPRSCRLSWSRQWSAIAAGRLRSPNAARPQASTVSPMQSRRSPRRVALLTNMREASTRMRTRNV